MASSKCEGFIWVNILANPIRQGMYDLLKENNVMYLSELMRSLNVYEHAIQHHLELMEKNGFLYTRYCYGLRFCSLHDISLSDIMEHLIQSDFPCGRVLKYYRDHQDQKNYPSAMAEYLHMHNNALINLLHKLVSNGFLEKRKKGSRMYYSLAPELLTKIPPV
jgi:predicted transcriptional regulator